AASGDGGEVGSWAAVIGNVGQGKQGKRTADSGRRTQSRRNRRERVGRAGRCPLSFLIDERARQIFSNAAALPSAKRVSIRKGKKSRASFVTPVKPPEAAPRLGRSGRTEGLHAMTSFPTALHHRIRELAQQAPDAPALAAPFQNDLRLSRGALDACASRLAQQLRAAGV
ncbi:hypothetical protein, partial [Burkholderia multivorans]|uniref:hypothetical protein n=1 Tax=Burkholderia multivorans TaxID=87883 RepID=UPI001C6585C7